MEALNKMNKKHLIITVLVLLYITITGYIMMLLPLEMLYSNQEFGDFVVTSSLPNKYSYRATLTSTYNVEPWRLKCVYKIRHFLLKKDIQPKIILQNSKREIPLNVHITENEPIKLYLDITEKKVFNALRYYKAKELTKTLLNNGKLELNPVFLRENTQGFQEISKVCAP